MKTTPLQHRGVLAVWCSTLLFAACAPPLPIDAAPCPCASGWTCCESNQVCVQAEDQCPAPPAIVVEPAAASIGAGRRIQFHGEGALAWRVEEPGGGTIDAQGSFLAPDVPGTYHVVATGPGRSLGRATVTVTPLRLEVVAGQPGGPSSLPIDGVGSRARLAGPGEMVLDERFVYVLDTSDCGLQSWPVPTSCTSVRRIDRASWSVDTLVRPTPLTRLGDGAGGYAIADGSLAEATFMSPNHLAVDGRGHLFVADYCLVRAIDLNAGTVRTVGGSGRFESLDAVNDCRLLQGIGGMASDGVDRLFVTRPAQDAIDEVRLLTEETGRLPLVPPTASAHGVEESLLDGPGLIAYDSDGEARRSLVVVDRNARHLNAVTLTGEGAQVVDIGEATDAPILALTARPGSGRPTVGVVAALENGWFRDVEYEQSAWRTLGFSNDAPAAGGLAYGALGERWASHPSTAVISRSPGGLFSMPTAVIGTSGGRRGAQDGAGMQAQLAVAGAAGAMAIAPNGDVWFADWQSHLIRRYRTATGAVETVFRDASSWAIAVDGDFLYAVPALTGFLLRAPLVGGGWERVAGHDGPPASGAARDGVGGAASLATVMGAVPDGQGNLWILDADLAHEVGPEGALVTLRRVRLADGQVTSLTDLPLGGEGIEVWPSLAFRPGDAATLYVTTSAGVEAVATATGARRVVLPRAAYAILDEPSYSPKTGATAISIDRSGKLYLIDAGWPVVYQLDLDSGAFTTLLGRVTEPAVLPGPVAEARVHQPAALGVLPSGDLVIADAKENVLLVVK